MIALVSLSSLHIFTMSANPCEMSPCSTSRSSVPVVTHLVHNGIDSTTCEQLRLLRHNSTLALLPYPCLTTPRGLVIAYRLLRHQSEPKDSRHRPTVDVSDNSDAVESPSTASETDSLKQAPPSLMVVVPGLFQTLDTIERAVLPLLEAHPQLTVLLVAPPGLPNTHWPAAASLDGEVRCSCWFYVFVRGPMGRGLGRCTSSYSIVRGIASQPAHSSSDRSVISLVQSEHLSATDSLVAMASKLVSTNSKKFTVVFAPTYPRLTNTLF